MTAYNLCGEVQSCQEVFLQNTNISLIDGGSISIYPNPTNGEFDLELNLSNATPLDVVVDVRGRSLHQESFEAGSGSWHHFDLQAVERRRIPDQDHRRRPNDHASFR